MTEAGGVRLKSEATIPSAEIVVLDRNFQFVHRDVGSLDIRLPPGVYTVQYRAGNAASDVPVSLRPGCDEVVLKAPELALKSPAPLIDNPVGALYGTLAVELSTQVHRRIGRGGELFLFVRRATSDMACAAHAAEHLFNVYVLDAAGRILASLTDAPRREGQDAARGYTLELDPGVYMLRFRAGDRTLEQSCSVCEGWQTQVFASSRRYDGSIATLGPNLPQAAVFMMRQGRGFLPDDAKIAWVESARQSLAHGGGMAPERNLREAVAEARAIRTSADPARMRELLMEKFSNPMLGIYGAHLLLQAPARDWSLLRDVVANLKLLIGPHPDVTALTLLPELEDFAQHETYAAPPMLRTSWSLIVGASARAPDIVAPRSYAERVADRMWDAGAWLVWRAPESATTQRSGAGKDGSEAFADTIDTFDDAIATVRRYLVQRLVSGGIAELLKETTTSDELTGAERTVLVQLASTADRAGQLIEAIRAESGIAGRVIDRLRDRLAASGFLDRARSFAVHELGVPAQWTSERLVSTLGLPAGTLERTVISLARKLRRAC